MEGKPLPLSDFSSHRVFILNISGPQEMAEETVFPDEGGLAVQQ